MGEEGLIGGIEWPIPESSFYRIFKHIMGSGNDPILVMEVRGESRAVRAVESLDAKLSQGEKDAGWIHYRDQGSSKRKTSSPPPSRKKSVKGSRGRRPDRRNRRT